MRHTGKERSSLYACCLVFTVVSLLGVGCAGPDPVLYPNSHLEEVGEDQAEQDIAECRQLAEEHVSSKKGEQVAGSTVVGAGGGAATGAVAGAISGSAGMGAAIGAATGATIGLLRGLFWASTPSRTYRNFVDRCLKESGYESMGWE